MHVCTWLKTYHVAQTAPIHWRAGYKANASACLQASTYLNKLPERFESDDKILISDPMLATGETAAQQP